MKKYIALIITAALLLCSLCGCGAQSDSDDGRINVITTTFPPYDVARAVAGDHIALDMLLSPETESHDFEPTLKEISQIQNCDVFIYIGGSSESWVDDVLAQIDTSSITIVRLIDCIDPAEAVFSNDSHDHSADEHCEHTANEYDDHIWTSPRNVILMAQMVCDALCRADSANSEAYLNGCSEYTLKLEELDAALTQLTSTAARHTLVFAERFPFAYLAKHYSLDYYAAFDGCSSDSEASLAVIADLINKVNSEKIPVVFYIEFSDETVADTICAATGAKKMILHSCHNLTQEDFESGITYLDLMLKNIENLREALN